MEGHKRLSRLFSGNLPAIFYVLCYPYKMFSFLYVFLCFLHFRLMFVRFFEKLWWIYIFDPIQALMANWRWQKWIKQMNKINKLIWNDSIFKNFISSHLYRQMLMLWNLLELTFLFITAGLFSALDEVCGTYLFVCFLKTLKFLLVVVEFGGWEGSELGAETHVSEVFVHEISTLKKICPHCFNKN